MKRNKKRIIAAVAVIGALAAGGAAFTAEIQGVPTNQTAGFAQTQVDNATVASVHYVLSTDGQFINSVKLQFSSPDVTTLSGKTIKAGFGDTATDAQLVLCTNDGADTTTPANTDAHCTFTTPVAVTAASYFDVSVTDTTGSYTSGYGS
jgi:hypothetical protein